MDRRNFITRGGLGIAAAIAASGCTLGGSASNSSMAGGVFYTKENPGRWSAQKKIDGHLPVVELNKSTKELIVTTNHGMKSFDHYIVKHMLLDSNFKFLTEKVFKVGTHTKPISKYLLTKDALKGYSGAIYALSVCNLHDTWMTKFTI